MSGPRRRAREIALQVLYELDANPEMAPEAALEAYFQHLDGPARESEEEAAESSKPADDRDFTSDLVLGTSARRQEIDDIITGLSRNWRLARMARVDRNVVRLALYELKFRDDVPVSVIINEAVELAKRFGTVEAGAFVNGLLDRAATELGVAR